VTAGGVAELIHLLPLSTWRELPAGAAYEPASLATEGFVHCSPDEATALAVAAVLDPGAGEPLAALVLDPDRLGAPVRWEAADPAPPPGVDPSVRFPHVYGPIPAEAVAEVRYARRDPAGRFVSLERRPPLAERLDLLPHPEGGWFRRTWVAPATLSPPGYGGRRASATAILFLLAAGERSSWHQLRSDEVWLWHRGGPLALDLGGGGEAPAGAVTVTLGPAVESGQLVQALVPAGTWQAARPVTAEEVLVSCVVSPGYDDADFRVAPDDGPAA
jgi:predicted cupin superfamily sugar epimerase/uncharacterized protein (DUF952 family)